MLSEAKTPMVEESAEKRGARKREEEEVEGSSTLLETYFAKRVLILKPDFQSRNLSQTKTNKAAAVDMSLHDKEVATFKKCF